MPMMLDQDLSPAKRSLLALRLKQRKPVARNVSIQPRPRREGSNRFPLSIAQEGIWFLDRLTRGNAALNMPAVVHITGPLNKPVLRKALQEVIRRHEILRTHIPTENQGPVQIAVADLDLVIEETNLLSLPSEAREAEIIRQAERQAQQEFDLSVLPLFKVRLIQINTDEHALIFILHHIIADGWSVGVLIQELNTLYRAFLMQTPSPLHPLPLQYGDFSWWQHSVAGNSKLMREFAYWKHELRNGAPVLKMDLDHSRGGTRSFKGATQRFWLSPQLKRRLAALAVQSNSTLFMVLFSAFAMVIFRCSHQTHFAIGTDVAGRNHSALEKLIGVFTNQLVIRCDLDGNPGFTEIVSRLKAKLLNAYAHQELPFEKLVGGLQISRDSAQSPLFRVKFVMPNIPLPELDFPGMSARFLELNPGSAKFDLTLFLEEVGGGLRVSAEYNSSSFDAYAIQTLFALFEETLTTVTINSNIALKSLVA